MPALQQVRFEIWLSWLGVGREGKRGALFRSRCFRRSASFRLESVKPVHVHTPILLACRKFRLRV